MRPFYLLSAAALVACALPASAAIVTLDFEGIPSGTPVADFYAPNYIFSPATLALVDSDAGGTGNFANEPSPDTVMFFLDGNNATLNVTNGFIDGFSFYYSSARAATVTVYDGFDATGNILASLDLVPQHTQNCTGDPNGDFCNWTPIGVTFAGTAYSIDFGGTANYVAFDNITFGSDVPGNGGNPGAVPEPASWLMMIAGFGLVGVAARRRRLAFAA